VGAGEDSCVAQKGRHADLPVTPGREGAPGGTEADILCIAVDIKPSDAQRS
jgi:hypothetical protein